MRIVGGKYKGRKLPHSSKLDLRPTTDFAKESLFNLLRTRIDIQDIAFLDLFAGTGAISFELISRGAAKGVCVDISSASFSYRKKLIEDLDFVSLRNIKKDVFAYLGKTGSKFDLIFADPPYDLARLAQIPDLVMESNLLSIEGLFILEHPEEHTFGQHPDFLEHRKYGRVNFTFFKKGL